VNPLGNPALSRYGYYAYRVIQLKRQLLWIRSRDPGYATRGWQVLAARSALNSINANRAALLSGGAVIFRYQEPE
jgi:hypothetical protein